MILEKICGTPLNSSWFTLADLFGSPALEYLAEGVSTLLLFVSIIALVKVVKEYYPDSPGCKSGVSVPQ